MEQKARKVIWWTRLKRRWPVLIWAGALSGALLLLDSSSISVLPGMVETRTLELAPLETGRLLAVNASPGQAVREGDVLATLDTSMLDAEMAREELDLGAQFLRLAIQTESELHTARLRQAECAAELAVLKDEAKRLEQLVEQQLVDAQALAGVRARQKSLEQTVELYPDIIASLERNLRLIRDGGSRVENLLAVEASDHLNLLRLRREACVIKALKDGTVSEVLRQPGEVIQAGLPVVLMVPSGPKRVIGWLTEDRSAEPSVGDKAGIVSYRRGVQPAPATVTAVNADYRYSVTGMPGQGQRGRWLVVMPDKDDGQCIPGESGRIRFSYPRWQLIM
jgi:HlyD family secretion protein